MTVEEYNILIEDAMQKRREMWKKLETVQQELDELTKELDISMDVIAYLKQKRDNTIEMGEDDEK